MDEAEGGEWLLSICFFLFYIQQISPAGCCGDRVEEVSSTPAPQTRSPTNVDLQAPGGNSWLWESQKGELGGGSRGRGRQQRREREAQVTAEMFLVCKSASPKDSTGLNNPLGRETNQLGPVLVIFLNTAL